jgi:hypothetical protein
VIPTSLSELINRIQKLGELRSSEDILVEFKAFDNIGRMSSNMFLGRETLGLLEE